MNIEDQFEHDINFSGWDLNKRDKSPRPTYHNCMNYLEKDMFDIKYNEHSGGIIFDGKEYNDDHTLKVKENMRSIKLEPSISTIDESIRSYAKNNAYNPVCDYLNNIKWDGTERLNRWLTLVCGTEDSEYTQFVSRTLILASVYRAFEPGCQYDFMPILEGEQGIGKTNLVRTLGGSWYKEISLSDRDHNTIQLMQGAWIIEVAELAVFAKRDIESLRGFISNNVDFTRFVYQKNTRNIPRRSAFIGTFNPGANGYLLDETGNRRFLPIYLKYVELEILKEIRDQLFAEAVVMYKNKVPIHINNDILQEQALQAQKQREEYDEWMDEIMKGLYHRRMDIGNNVTAIQLYTTFLGGTKDKYTQLINRRIYKCMKSLGCKKAEVKRVNGILGRYYDITQILGSVTSSDSTVDFEL